MLHRRQYPAVLAFTITIKNKSQGQRFVCNGMYVDRPLLIHVQLHILPHPDVDQKVLEKSQKVVWKDVL